jgi:hypothetical protein
MIDTEKLDAVMKQTGADYETAKAALKTSNGDVDIAVRIIRTYNLKNDSAFEDSDPSTKSGQNEQSHTYGQKDQTKTDEQGNQSGTSEEIPIASEILEAIKDIWKKGNASRLDIQKEGKTLLSISLVIGTIGLILAPVAALIGIGAALITEYEVLITLDNGTVINVNEFVINRKKSTGD